MKKSLTALVLGLATAGSAATWADAQSRRNCAPRDAVLDRLTNTFGETRQTIGLGANNTVIELFASTSSGTWTIIATTPNGVTCLVASGRAFEIYAEAPGVDA